MVGDIGKRKEPKLFESFGGRPTEMLLSHQHALNRLMLADRHKKLASYFRKSRFPRGTRNRRILRPRSRSTQRAATNSAVSCGLRKTSSRTCTGRTSTTASGATSGR
jgi:hypothetical protein